MEKNGNFPLSNLADGKIWLSPVSEQGNKVPTLFITLTEWVKQGRLLWLMDKYLLYPVADEATNSLILIMLQYNSLTFWEIHLVASLHRVWWEDWFSFFKLSSSEDPCFWWKLLWLSWALVWESIFLIETLFRTICLLFTLFSLFPFLSSFPERFQNYTLFLSLYWQCPQKLHTHSQAHRWKAQA